ncbi:Monocarboxylate transporter 10 [Acipenser ruthenus]|uniref:Monocarboxylate transporter 10 n=1 Tax=Acipenser ruthenus TaxID=7906 RepID=A0A662YWQ1_ACIRT|nr:Monocarboxylate transporter 10 [Acipenser ruthenus]
MTEGDLKDAHSTPPAAAEKTNTSVPFPDEEATEEDTKTAEKTPLNEDVEKSDNNEETKGSAVVKLVGSSDPDCAAEAEFEHPEGGWGWVVMLAAMWCNGVIFGIQNSFGIFFISLLDEFGSAEDKSLKFNTAWVGSLSMGMIFFCSPIVSVFTDLFGCRKTAVAGAAVGLIGLFASSFVRSVSRGFTRTFKQQGYLYEPVFKLFKFSPVTFSVSVGTVNLATPLSTEMAFVEERFGKDVNKESLLTCIGITSGVGRMIFGRVADYVPGANKVYLQVSSFLVIGVLSMMIPLCQVFGGLIAVCLLMGLFDGCFICIMAPIAFELVGSQNASQAIGFLLGMMSLPMIVGPPIAGMLRDKLGTYNEAFYLAGIPPIIGGLVLCFIPYVERRKQQQQQQEAAAHKMLDGKANSVLQPYNAHEEKKELECSI